MGVTLLAILTILFGLGGIFIGLGLIGLAAIGGVAGFGFLAGLLGVFGAIILLFGILGIVAGIGLWRMRGWAWWLAVIVGVLSIISGALTASWITVGLWLLILIYLVVIRQHFGVGAPPQPAMPQPPSM